MQVERASLSASQFFDAALHPDRWPGLLNKLLQCVGQTSAALSGQGRSAMTGPFFSHGLDEDRIAVFMRDYAHSSENMAIDVFDKAPLRRAVPWDTLVSRGSWESIPIARDLIRPMGLEMKFAASLFWDGEYGALLSVLGPPDDHPITEHALEHVTAQCEFLAPAFEITCRLAIAERENLSLWNAFSKLGLGLITQTSSGQITRMNPVAEALLGGPEKPFQLANKGSVAALKTGGVQALGHDVLLVAEHVDKPMLALRLPMQTSRIGRWSESDAFVIVLIELNRTTPSLPKVMRIAFGATPRQLEIAELVLDGVSSKDIAATCSIAPSTVETHIDRLCLQVGVANRTELRSWMMQVRAIV